jgi:hypothetical protein
LSERSLENFENFHKQESLLKYFKKSLEKLKISAPAWKHLDQKRKKKIPMDFIEKN